jgi:hypothetical protein
MLNDTDAACVTIRLAVCLKKGKESPLNQTSGTDEDRNTHTKTLWQI